MNETSTKFNSETMPPKAFEKLLTQIKKIEGCVPANP